MIAGGWFYLIEAHILKGPKRCAKTEPRATLAQVCTAARAASSSKRGDSMDQQRCH